MCIVRQCARFAQRYKTGRPIVPSSLIRCGKVCIEEEVIATVTPLTYGRRGEAPFASVYIYAVVVVSIYVVTVAKCALVRSGPAELQQYQDVANAPGQHLRK